MLKNKDLLLKAKASILAEPEHFNMYRWMSGEKYTAENMEEAASVDLTQCGTTACIGGWLIYHAFQAKRVRKSLTPISEKASLLLGIPYDYRSPMNKADDLFVLNEWPGDLRSRYFRAKKSETRARIAAERIDRFIEEMEATDA